MWSNCIVWAVLHHLKKDAEYIAAGMPKGKEPAIRIRRSRLEPRWVRHWQSEFFDPAEGCLVLEQFVPDDPRPLKGIRVLKAIWFKGHVRRGDFPDTELTD